MQRRILTLSMAIAMAFAMLCPGAWGADTDSGTAVEATEFAATDVDADGADASAEESASEMEAVEDAEALEAERPEEETGERDAAEGPAEPEPQGRPSPEEETGERDAAEGPAEPEPQAAPSSNGTFSGMCGEKLNWTLNESGLLTISGTGAMTEYDYTSDIPWYNQRTQIRQVVMKSGVKTIGKYAFYYCEYLTSVTIPDSVVSIGSYAFQACTRLTKVTVPGSVNTIGSYAFDSCSSLTSAVILGHVTSIDVYTFGACSSLTSVSLPSSVKTIGWWAFRQCGSLTSITIPASVKTIEGYAFAGAEKLKSVYFRGNAPSINDYAFSGDTFTAYYPSGNKTWTKAKMKQYGGKIKWVNRISVPTVSLKSLTSPQKGWIKVMWKGAKGVSGYRLQISESANFKSGKQKTVNPSSRESGATMSGLKSGKTYYARIRAWKKSGSKTYYGAWSKSKAVKVK